MNKFLLFIAIILTMSTSCNSSKKTNGGDSFPIGIHDIWALHEMHDLESNGGAVIPFAVLGNHPTLEINTTQLKVFGNDGCNEFQGVIEKLTANEIKLGSIGGTKKMCPNMKISNKYSSLLDAVTYFKLKGLTLLLLDNDKNVILQFKKVD